MKNLFSLNHLSLIKALLTIFVLCSLIEAQTVTDDDFIEYLNSDTIIKDQSAKIFEYELYLKNFNRNELSEKIAFQTGEYFQKQKNPDKAIFYYTQILFFRDKSLYYQKAFDRVDSILTYNVKRFTKADPVLLLQKIKSHSAKKETAFLFLDYIDFLATINSQKTDQIALEYCNSFIEKELAPKINDAVIFWIARLYQRLGDKPRAIIKYLKCFNKYESSSFAPQAALKAANLIKEYYKNYNAARDLYIDVINSYPDTEYAGDAQYLLARTFRLYLNDPVEALNQYQIHFTLFPENKYVDSSYFEMAELLYNEERYEESLQTYISLVEETANSELLLDVVIKVYNILEKHFNKSETQATTLLYLGQLVKDEQEKVKLFTKAAEIFELLGNSQKAREIKDKLKEPAN